MPKSYPPAFRRKVLDLLDAGRSVAADLDLSTQTIYNWREQELIDTGRDLGFRAPTTRSWPLLRKRIAELEAELAATRRATELMKKEVVRPKGDTQPCR
jgi:hypothetical protein